VKSANINEITPRWQGDLWIVLGRVADLFDRKFEHWDRVDKVAEGICSKIMNLSLFRMALQEYGILRPEKYIITKVNTMQK
jgi:hypothetical protein